MNIRNTSLFRMMAALVVTLSLVLMPSSCSNDSLIEQVPRPISEFITQYYPGYSVAQYDHNGTTYHIRLKNGPGMNFSEAYSWESVDGYGLPLPQVFLFDQTPPKLYSYLQGTSALNSVFSIARNSTEYTVTLLDSTLIYDIASQEISSPALTN
ncbi:MAG: hypothetical protein HDS99_03710 [Bacteroidales bacterium]|nr:hypothetical protein [Bacteroidales bacterium]